MPESRKIVVLERSFVYVGDVTIEDGWCVIERARNIRVWGTTKGLGELALDGPTAKTVLDEVGTVRAPIHAVIHLLDVDCEKWQKS